MTRRVFRGRAPVAQTREPECCAACGTTGTDLVYRVSGGIGLTLCPDARLGECTIRYRKGLTPNGYQNYLRALAAVETYPAR